MPTGGELMVYSSPGLCPRSRGWSFGRPRSSLELPSRTFCNERDFLYLLSNTVSTSHMWLLEIQLV